MKTTSGPDQFPNLVRHELKDSRQLDLTGECIPDLDQRLELA